MVDNKKMWLSPGATKIMQFVCQLRIAQPDMERTEDFVCKVTVQYRLKCKTNSPVYQPQVTFISWWGKLMNCLTNACNCVVQQPNYMFPYTLTGI